MIDFDAARKRMVDCQLRTNGIVDERVLSAMGQVPREAFVDAPRRAIAYLDEDLALGDGRYLIEPLVLARLLQMAAPTPDDAALVVGCGTGYVSAVVSRLASSVVAIESDSERARQSAALLTELGYDNVAVVEGAMHEGYRAQAPYHVILISGAVAAVPMQIAEQLDDDGRLACVVDVQCEGLGRAVLVTRHHGVLSERVYFDASVPVLPEFAREEGFVF